MPCFSTRVDARDSLGVFVDIVAGINVVTREAFWEIESIDPATGSVPTNPLIGFLLINDSLARGEGSVSFTVRPASDVVTRDQIDAEASIFFDFNAPIVTPAYWNTIDAGAPTSVMDTAVTFVDSNTVTSLVWRR